MQKKLSSGVLILFLSFVSVGLSGQSVTGKWKTIDDETGEERSIVELYEKGGAIFGKVMRFMCGQSWHGRISSRSG